MKHLVLMGGLLYITAGTVCASEDNDKFFIAYNAAQTSKLPEVLKKRMQSTTNLDNIAVEVLNKMGKVQLAQQYYNRPDLQNKLRPLVQNAITSRAGTELIDDASTKLYSTLYSSDELKAIYQNNKLPEGQNFIQANMQVDLSVQDFINRAYKQKFDKSAIDQLELNIQNVYKKYQIDTASLNPQPVQTPSVAEQAQAKTEVKDAIVADEKQQNLAPVKTQANTAEQPIENKESAEKQVNNQPEVAQQQQS